MVFIHGQKTLVLRTFHNLYFRTFTFVKEINQYFFFYQSTHFLGLGLGFNFLQSLSWQAALPLPHPVKIIQLGHLAFEKHKAWCNL